VLVSVAVVDRDTIGTWVGVVTVEQCTMCAVLSSLEPLSLHCLPTVMDGGAAVLSNRLSLSVDCCCCHH
jgi:hypothetical protein